MVILQSFKIKKSGYKILNSSLLNLETPQIKIQNKYKYVRLKQSSFKCSTNTMDYNF